MKAGDLEKMNNPPSVLIYGPAGCGKTALASQMAGGYMFDFDNGMRTAQTLKDKFSEERHKIEFDLYRDPDPRRPTKWMEARTKMLKFVDQIAQKTFPFDSIVVDSLTGMARAITLQVMFQAGDSFRKPEIQHWGDMVQQMEIALTIFRSFGVPLVVTAHELSLELDESDVVRPMSITKQHSLSKLAWLFDEVLYMKVRPSPANQPRQYVVTGRSSSSVMARTRSGLLEDIVVNEIGMVGLLERMGYKYIIKTEKTQETERKEQ